MRLEAFRTSASVMGAPETKLKGPRFASIRMKVLVFTVSILKALSKKKPPSKETVI